MENIYFVVNTDDIFVSCLYSPKCINISQLFLSCMFGSSFGEEYNP